MRLVNWFGFAALFVLSAPCLCGDTLYVTNYISKTVEKVASDGSVSTFANLTQGPSGLAFDPAGNLFVNSNGAILRYSSSGFGSFFADSNSSYAAGIAFDGSGNLFAATSLGSTVEKFTPDGTHTIFASSGLNEPYAVAFDGAGNLFVSNDGDYTGGVNGTIVKFSPDGTPSVFATGFHDPEGLAFDANGNLYVAETLPGTYTGIIEKVTPDGTRSVFVNFGADIDPVGLAFDRKGNLYAAVTNQGNNTYFVEKITPDGTASLFATVSENPIGIAVTSDAGVPLVLPVQHPDFFSGAAALDNGVSYLAFSNGNYFGYYSFLSDPNYLYHFDLGYEYVFDAADGKAGVYFYDFASSTFFYTSPTFPFPYLYDFSLNSVVYYYPDPNPGNPGHYNTNGVRYFYVFSTGQIISK